MKKGLLRAITVVVLGFLGLDAVAQCGTTPHAGDLIISSNTTLSGTHNVAGIFRVEAGITVTVEPYSSNGCGELIINAASIEIIGNIDADGAGLSGGVGGAGATTGNNISALTGCLSKDNCMVIEVDPGQPGASANPPGGGVAGVVGTLGRGPKQQCNLNNDDFGFVPGAGGAGGGGGGSYGGAALTGGTGGAGAAYNANNFTSGGSLASCTGTTTGTGGAGGGVTAAYGTQTGPDIDLGAGGGGAGGGGKSAGNGGNGGIGGSGGGKIILNSSGTLSVLGTVSALGNAGAAGGVGGAGGGGSANRCCEDGCNGCDEVTYSSGAGGGAGAGGGSGGGILITANGLATITGTLRTSGGAGGAGGAGGDASSSPCSHSSLFCASTGGSSNNGNPGQQGGGGSGGRIKVFTNPCFTNVVTPTTQVGGGTGQGGAAGAGTVHIASLPGFTPPTASTVITAPSCFGDSDATAVVTVSNGVAPIVFTWPVGVTHTDVGNVSTATGLAAGTYDVIIQDAGACSITETITIDDPAVLSGQVIDAMDTDCFGASTGEATVMGMGGTGAYTFTWPLGVSHTENGDESTATGLEAGSYDVTITDANGCTDMVTVTIADPAPFAATVTIDQNVTCNGADDGIATVNVVGTPGVTFSWNSPGNPSTATATGLPAGSWQVTVASSSTCDTVVTVTITEPNALNPIAVQASQVSCPGGNDGVASVAVTGGTQPFEYQWDNSGLSTDASATGLTAGTYNVIITDANNCVANASVNITEPAPINIALDVDDAGCFGAASGQITANVSGGTSPYTYAWNPGNLTGQTVTGITAGNYNVTVTDVRGCTQSFQNIIVGQPTAVTATISQLSNISCNGADDGSITVDAAGGTGPYTYQWNDPTIQTTATATDLAPGNYGVVVLDANNCPATVAGLVISEPDPLSASVSSTTPVTCEGGEDGTAQAEVVGGTLPYTYLWSDADGQQSGTAIGLEEGDYTVAVTDANGCSASASASIGAPLVQLTADFSLSPDSGLQPLDITVTNTSVGGTSYEWYFGDGNVIVTTDLSDFNYMYADSGAFDVMLVATDENTGCVDTLLLAGAIYIEPTSALNVPNVITPNGDGINDMFPIDPTQGDFFPFEIRNIKDFTGQVFNRWGQLVYEWTQPLGGWEGRTLSGVPVEPATYYYVITAVGIDGDSETQYELKGSVLVVR